MLCSNNQELFAMRGVPGCGKSTWANAWVAGAPRRARVSRDDIRFQLFGKYFDVDEVMVTDVQDAMIRSLLSKNYSVVVDNTHISLKSLRQLKNLAGNQMRFAVIQLDVPVEVAIERNANRDRIVPEDVIRNMYIRLQASPLPDEWRF
jgi:predicted kinase